MAKVSLTPFQFYTYLNRFECMRHSRSNAPIGG